VPGGEHSAELVVRAVYAEHGRAMRAYATRLLGDPVAAEDIVQEALVRLWRNPQVLHNGKGSVRGWLLTVVRNLVTDRIRARAARPPETTGGGPVQGDHAVGTGALRMALLALSDQPAAEVAE
jgi:RNA polymerase sigma-70 factor (ECF subfamily)